MCLEQCICDFNWLVQLAAIYIQYARYSIQKRLTKTTDRRIKAGRDNTPAAAAAPPVHMCELLATTPPHISDTRTTDANGVNLETNLHKPGRYSFSNTPKATGAKTTLAHATHRAMPLTGTVLPMINLVSSGVTAAASTVLQDVSRTLNAKKNGS